MNDQAIAILNGAIAQLGALAASQQSTIDTDATDAAAAQAKLDADQADITKQTDDLASTNSIAASLQALVDASAVPV